MTTSWKVWHLGRATRPYILSHIVVSPSFVHVVLMASEAISISVVDLVSILTLGEPKVTVLSIPMVDTLFSVLMADGRRDH